MHHILDAASVAAPQWLSERQNAGRRAWAASAMPTRKTEAWKYTSLHRLDADFAVAQPSVASQAELAFEHPALGGSKLVFVDGYLRADLSCLALPEGVELIRFADADAAQVRQISQQLGSVADPSGHLFA